MAERSNAAVLKTVIPLRGSRVRIPLSPPFFKKGSMSIQLGIYTHYKGKLYEVIGTAQHTETLEQLVVYRALYDNFDLWIRPLDMFCESVMINNTPVKRFTYSPEQNQ